MKRSRFFFMIVTVLSIGLASASGCSTTISQESLVAQPTTETPVIPPTSVTPVIPPTSVTPTQPTPTPTTVSSSTIQQVLADIRSKAEQPSPGIYYVDAVTAKKLLDDTQAIFLDARYLVDYDEAHISGAVSLPVSSVWKGDIDPTTIVPDKEAVYITYCAPGCPAGLELARELSIHGYYNLFVLSGGYLVWKDAGYPMDKQH